MFRNENAFREFISKKLQDEGYELMGSDIAIHGLRRVDLLMKKNYKITAIEVKLRDRRGIANDIAKLSRLRFLPDVDFFFVAAPKINLQEDILGFAKRMEVGVFAVTEQGIELLTQSQEEPPASLQGSTGTPVSVKAGEVFEIKMTVSNMGGKMARNIEIMYMPASPFRVPKGEKNHKFLKELMPDKAKSVTFKIRVESNTKSGRYRLYARRTAERLRPADYLFDIEVEKET